MILICKLKIVVQQSQCYQLKMKLSLLSNGITIPNYKIMMGLLLPCIQHIIVNKYLMNIGTIILICKILIVGLQPWIQQEWELFHLNNGIIIQFYKTIIVGQQQCSLHFIVSKYQMSVGTMIQLYKIKMEILLHYSQQLKE